MNVFTVFYDLSIITSTANLFEKWLRKIIKIQE